MRVVSAGSGHLPDLRDLDLVLTERHGRRQSIWVVNPEDDQSLPRPEPRSHGARRLIRDFYGAVHDDRT
jgi:hypothetical protein